MAEIVCLFCKIDQPEYEGFCHRCLDLAEEQIRAEEKDWQEARYGSRDEYLEDVPPVSWEDALAEVCED